MRCYRSASDNGFYAAIELGKAALEGEDRECFLGNWREDRVTCCRVGYGGSEDMECGVRGLSMCDGGEVGGMDVGVRAWRAGMVG